MKYPIELINDGHAKLSLDYEPEQIGNVAIFVASDDGGFTSIYADKEQIDKMISQLKKISEVLNEKAKS